MRTPCGSVRVVRVKVQLHVGFDVLLIGGRVDAARIPDRVKNEAFVLHNFLVIVLTENGRQVQAVRGDAGRGGQIEPFTGMLGVFFCLKALRVCRETVRPPCRIEPAAMPTNGSHNWLTYGSPQKFCNTTTEV
jgi:hypothetical protein